jgi:hypothetical protein
MDLNYCFCGIGKMRFVFSTTVAAVTPCDTSSPKIVVRFQSPHVLPYIDDPIGHQARHDFQAAYLSLQNLVINFVDGRRT